MLSATLSRWFPVPRYLAAPAAGLDISDASVKWLELESARSGYRVASYGIEPLPQGVVVNGAIRDPHALSDVLRSVKGEFKTASAVHAALPEEGAFVFPMHVPEGSSRKQTLSMIEFELEGRVPIPPAQAIYDYDIISERGSEGMEIGVVVFVREIAEAYAGVCREAGLELRSLEIEARSIGRAACRETDQDAMLLVDFGLDRTGIAVVKRGIPIFTTTVEVGGRHLSEILTQKLSYSGDEIERFKNEHGLVPEKGLEVGTEASMSVASALADEVVQYYRFWNSRRDGHGERETPLSGVLLLGGSANLLGLPDYIASRVQADVSLPNVWRGVCSFDDYIPPITRRCSLQYATAIGLARRGLGL